MGLRECVFLCVAQFIHSFISIFLFCMPIFSVLNKWLFSFFHIDSDSAFWMIVHLIYLVPLHTSHTLSGKNLIFPNTSATKSTLQKLDEWSTRPRGCAMSYKCMYVIPAETCTSAYVNRIYDPCVLFHCTSLKKQTANKTNKNENKKR